MGFPESTPKPRDAGPQQIGDGIIHAADVIAHNPSLRANYFLDPEGVVDRAIGQYVSSRRRGQSSSERPKLRGELGVAIERVISADPRLISARESYFERRAFLTEALRNPQRTYDAIFYLSIAAFVFGVVFLVIAVVTAVRGEAEIGGIFGAGSIFSVIGTTLTLSRDSIRQANADNAQIRLVLTDFSTELTHYRAIPIKDFKEAIQRNREIRTTTTSSVMHLPPRPEPPSDTVGANQG